MKLINLKNKTRYLKRDLMRLFNYALKYYHKYYNFPARLNLTCINRRKDDGFCGGSAYYNSNLVTLKLPRQDKYGSDNITQRIVRTLYHELMHCRGLKHGDMSQDCLIEIPDVSGFQLRRYAEIVKPKTTIDDKIRKLLERRRNWESKLLRAENAIKKLDKKVKYYHSKITN